MAEIPDLQGKPVGIVLANAPLAQWGFLVLENVNFVNQGGREFITGIISTLQSEDWVAGLPAAVAWEAVGYYIVFSSHDEYQSRVARAKRPWWRRLFAR